MVSLVFLDILQLKNWPTLKYNAKRPKHYSSKRFNSEVRWNILSIWAWLIYALRYFSMSTFHLEVIFIYIFFLTDHGPSPNSEPNLPATHPPSLLCEQVPVGVLHLQLEGEQTVPSDSMPESQVREMVDPTEVVTESELRQGQATLLLSRGSKA